LCWLASTATKGSEKPTKGKNMGNLKKKKKREGGIVPKKARKRGKPEKTPVDIREAT